VFASRVGSLSHAHPYAHPVEITNPDRVVFPEDGITKGDVVAYYDAVAERMLPFVRDRALTVERFPKGIAEEGFMQKNAPDHYPEDLVRRHRVPKEDGGTTTFPVIDRAEGIAFFANQGAITFHTPPVTVDDERHPDWAIWDLDPPPGRVAMARAVAKALRAVLDEYGIRTVLMTSGSKGYHLRAPLRRGAPVDVVATVARGIAALAAHAHDDLMTLAFKKAERGDRVFVDWLRNSPHATSVVPWSLRPRPGAPIAAPIAWDDLDAVEPDAVRLREVGDTGEDPWAGVEPTDLAPLADAVAEELDGAGIALEPFDRFRS
jgi:bifunctional non-homologous end joining protein LigD